MPPECPGRSTKDTTDSLHWTLEFTDWSSSLRRPPLGPQRGRGQEEISCRPRATPIRQWSCMFACASHASSCAADIRAVQVRAHALGQLRHRALAQTRVSARGARFSARDQRVDRGGQLASVQVDLRGIALQHRHRRGGHVSPLPSYSVPVAATQDVPTNLTSAAIALRSDDRSLEPGRVIWLPIQLEIRPCPHGENQTERRQHDHDRTDHDARLTRRCVHAMFAVFAVPFPRGDCWHRAVSRTTSRRFVRSRPTESAVRNRRSGSDLPVVNGGEQQLRALRRPRRGACPTEYPADHLGCRDGPDRPDR
ncbi:hypothetical protein SAMN04488074_102553 [Lentzea albidocapillata subsp. violacea]|uniref:Uncharacterized protein n=1 Tax=Lentzea albidocapillata subsp. violacea TaxID=128104 RepID=A0A1G8V8V7_9PSEU|nr:hypothetical protein SAMN04488074_102553 [Lentzea albidocapillata subsp. violacea]